MSKKQVFVEHISDDVMKCYNKIDHQVSSKSKCASNKCTRESYAEVMKMLRSQHDECKSADMKREINSVIADIDDLKLNGEAKLFVAHNNNKSEMEYVCGVIRKYEENNVTLYDYFYSSYLYTKTINQGALAGGLVTIGMGIGAGVATFFTGGIALPLFLGAASAVAGTTGGVITYKALDTDLDPNIRVVLEGCFIHELVRQKYAIIHGKQLFLTFK